MISTIIVIIICILINIIIIVIIIIIIISIVINIIIIIILIIIIIIIIIIIMIVIIIIIIIIIIMIIMSYDYLARHVTLDDWRGVTFWGGSSRPCPVQAKVTPPGSSRLQQSNKATPKRNHALDHRKQPRSPHCLCNLCYNTSFGSWAPYSSGTGFGSDVQIISASDKGRRLAGLALGRGLRKGYGQSPY